MSTYLVIKIESDNSITLKKKGLTLTEAQEYVGDDDTLVIIEDFNG